jgi:acyl-CoA hydrolase/GNAT superfamily N-acetyltransferase
MGVLGMDSAAGNINLEALRAKYPHKFAAEKVVFNHIHAGDRIFIGTGCGEPQYLVRALINYVESHPKAFYDTEVIQVWTLGVAPYTDEKFKSNFRHNSFFIGKNTRHAVNECKADYTPISLSEVPRLFRRKVVPVDVALIQTSLPDKHGYLSLGISVDIVKVAVENAALVIAQVNPQMPRVHGDSFLHVENVDYILPYDEPLLEYPGRDSDKIVERLGGYVARVIEDGDTIQVGYGHIPNSVLTGLYAKKNLGVHTELLSDGIVELMQRGVVDNSQKEINRGKTVAAFCMGKRETYAYLHNHPGVEFRTIDYTNNPLVIAQHLKMVAINSALEIDLTGQATAESLGKTFYSGIGGQADFMRGAVLSPGGKTIMVLQSTSKDGLRSRIVPFLQEGVGVSLIRSDLHYVITEYGIAYLYGKNIRERAMSLISIAHPKFRPRLVDEAKRLSLIYMDQGFIPGARGEYPEDLETYKTTKSGMRILLRPVKISDEPLLKDFFYALSDKSLYKRFFTTRRDIPHRVLQDYFVVIDYTKEMVILAIEESEGTEVILGVGQFGIIEGTMTAEIAMVVRDDYQNKGIGTELLSRLTFIARRQGLLGFKGETHYLNTAVFFHLFEKMGFKIKKKIDTGLCLLNLTF